MLSLTSITPLHSSRTKRLSSLVLWLALRLQLFAAGIPTPADGVVTFNGFTSRTSGNVVTYSIPLTGYPSTLEVNLRGGDGGFAQSGGSSNPTKRASKGGGGILGVAKFSIHPTTAGALRPGGEIRLIVGNKGYDRQSGLYAHAASGGGGGSGLVYRGPENGGDWKPLIIAGGGGGAYASTVTGKAADNRHGGNGQSTESGQRGMGNGPLGGSDGAGGSAGTHGNNTYDMGGGGGGWLTGGSKGGGRGYTVGGAGGVLSVNTNKGAHGGFGCGAGGDGGKTTFAGGFAMSGGGGGGYSGGGGGANAHGGGGGGSYLVSLSNGGIKPLANSASWTPRGAGLKQHGFVSIETAGTGTGSVLPTISGSLTVTVDFSSTHPYVDSGISAKDFLGQSIALNITSGNVDRSASGNYDLEYEAIDKFGQKVTATRTVTVTPGSQRPTFTATPDPVEVRKSSSQSHIVASNFQANGLGGSDHDEAFVRYEIVNNSNPDAFAVEPAIDSTGESDALLSFTPEVGAVGSATLTIIAVDDGLDSSLVESQPQLIEIWFNIEPTQAKFVTGLAPEEFGTSVEIDEDTFSLVVGTIKSTDPDNPEDLTYSLAGPDASQFSLVNDVLSFKTLPDYETDTPDDASGSHVYRIQITTKDYRDENNTFSEVVSSLTIQLNDIDEKPSAPVFKAGDDDIVAENQTAVGTLISTDPEGTDVTFELHGTDEEWFTIGETSGVLAFVAAPDFENPDDYDENNYYNINVIAKSGGQTKAQAFVIRVTNAEELLSTPTLTNNTVQENTKNVGQVQSIDPDGTDVAFELSEAHGPDWQLFTLDSSSGALAFKVAPDYEALIEDEGNTTFNITVTASSGGDSISQSFAIEITDVDEAPTAPALKEGSDSNIVENQTEVGVIESTDPDGTAISYAISGEYGLDSDKFEIHPTSGLLSMKNAPDYENPGYNEEVPVYEVCVVATSNGLSTLGFFEVVVTDVDELPTLPVISNNSVTENTTAIGTVTATAGGQPVVYEISITEGADWRSFQINGNNGELSFINAPNYESPIDAGTDNNYEVVVIAHSFEGSSKNTFIIEVTDTNDPLAQLELDNLSVTEGNGGVGFLSAVDEDGSEVLFEVSSESGADSGYFEISNALGKGYLIFKQEPNFEQPTDANTDNLYEVTVVARSDGDSISKTFNITVINAPDPPQTPTLNNHSIVENTTVVGTVSAFDEDSELRYSIVVNDDDELLDGELFEIDQISGELRFKTAPDYEAPTGEKEDNTYLVTVGVNPLDNVGSNYDTFTITVTNDTSYAIQEFRTEYNLSSDGSDDWLDRSGNGIPNIGYLMLGLGDPSNPSPAPASDKKPGLPNAHKTENPRVIAYTYSLHRTPFLIATPQVSNNLIDWSDSRSNSPTFVPLGEINSGYIDSELNTEADSNYTRVTIFYLIEEDYGEFGDQPAYPGLFFNMKLESD